MTAPQDISPLDKALLDAAGIGDVRGVRTALEQGAGIEACLPGGNTALSLCASKGYHNIARYLLERGANPHVLEQNGDSPLFRATWQGDEEMVVLLLEYGADPNWPPKDPEVSAAGRKGFLSLHRASVMGELGIARQLIRAGADMSMCMSNGGVPLWYAGANKQSGVCAALLAAGADPDGGYENQRLNAGPPPKMEAAWHPVIHKMTERGHLPVLRMLLDAGADKDKQDNYGITLEATLRSMPQDTTGLLAVLEEYGRYPAFAESMLPELTKAQLFAPNEHGYCLMDSPSTWRHFAAIADRLEQAGEGFTAAELEATGKNGKNWLERGAECFAGREVLTAYIRAGGDIGAQLLDANRQSTPLLEVLCARQQIGQVMKAELWREVPQARETVRDVCNALPAAHRQDVANQHQLIAQLGQYATTGRGR